MPATEAETSISLEEAGAPLLMNDSTYLVRRISLLPLHGVRRPYGNLIEWRLRSAAAKQGKGTYRAAIDGMQSSTD
ncbi:unnamed protein product [Linum tenue]|uniref:Uncharacterized protein n=1 Tax=Linum tenue TaxID=586396 RepID=A0AAV0QYY5_9ROSI|nr:unnamed protein product [Linum tenue]